ncbi:MAG: hypothetical protein [Bacteriophage sp.]|nr:MAG: hypothetical protein [Bacteriophage sp.]
MTLNEFRRHPAYDYYIRTLVSNCLICELDNKFDYKYKNIVYIKLARYLCLGIDCRAVILKQVKYEKK